jgi:hypothetical protein
MTKFHNMPTKRFWSVLAVLAIFSASFAFGSTLTATNTSDSGPGSLRAALADAANGDTITFSVPLPATIRLKTPLTFGPSVTISGPGVAISVQNGPVLIVNKGAIVTISGVTIEDGNFGLGGCVFNEGTLTLLNSTVTTCWNPSELGGGIFNAGMLALLNSSVTGNLAGNGASNIGVGAGIFNWLGTVTLTNSTVSGNLTTGGIPAIGGGGGGIFNYGGTIAVDNSTISNNSSSVGGGIFNYAGTLGLLNSTVALNTAVVGGGIKNADGTLTMAFTTIWNNTASTDIAGIQYPALPLPPPPSSSGGSGCPPVCIQITNGFVEGGGGISFGDGSVSLKNSIFSANIGANCSGATEGEGNNLSDEGYNLSDDASCMGIFTQADDLNSASAGLDPGGLKNNGGATQTIALLATSPAVNAVPLSSCTDVSGNPVTTDQRGVERPQDGACDIGAFEYFYTLARPPQPVAPIGMIKQ